MRFFFIILAVTSIVCGCRPSSPTSSSLTFGDGDAILKVVLDAALAGHETEFSMNPWGGGSSGNQFDVQTSLIIKNLSVGEFAAKLSTELDKLPATRGWKSHGSGSGGVGSIQNYEISYEEDNSQFYFDFILVQNENDVEVLILHKGIRK